MLMYGKTIRFFVSMANWISGHEKLGGKRWLYPPGLPVAKEGRQGKQ